MNKAILSNSDSSVLLIDSLKTDLLSIFLNFGENFTNNYTIIKEIISVSSETLNDSFGVKIEQKISELFSIFFRIEIIIKTSELVITKSIVHLEEIDKYIDQTSSFAESFNKIVKQLVMLGIATKIENARLNNDATGFNILAENVENLSKKIKLRQNDISESTKNLNLQCTKIINKIDDIKLQHSTLKSDIFSNKDKAIKELSSNYEHTLESIKQVKSVSENISKNINEIISAIQYSDITSQQMEHIITSLNNAKIKIENENIDVESAITYCSIIKLQQAQINNTEYDLETSINKIKDSMEKIRNSTFDLKHVFQFSGSKKSSENSLGEIKTKIDSTKVLIKKNYDVHLELINSVSEVFSTVETLSGFISEIEEVGTEIELISLNAIVKSAHTGKEGAALGVLSEAIQHLSNSAKEETTNISKLFEKIKKETEELKKINVEQTGELQKNEISNIVVQLENEIYEFSDMEKTLNDKLDMISSNLLNIENSIETQINRIDVNNEIGEKVKQVHFLLNKSVEDLVNEFSIDDESLKMDLSELSSQYSMQSERDVHNSLKKDSAELELYESFENFEQFPDDENLGENIELF